MPPLLRARRAVLPSALTAADHEFRSRIRRTIALIMTGVSAAAYAVGAIGEYVISGRLRRSLRRQRMQNDIDRLQGHYTVCGYGRVGRQAVEELTARGLRAVVVEPRDDATIDEGTTLRIRGDATDDGALRAAGIDRAAGLVAVAGDDAINIVVTLSARALNPEMDIVARAIQPEVEDKLRRAGATQVISPYRIGGSPSAAKAAIWSPPPGPTSASPPATC